MALPKQAVLTFETTLPILGIKVKYRPFLVKEKKILLMAIQGGDERQILISFQQMIQNCIVDDSIKDVTALSTIDLGFLFIKIRIVSEIDGGILEMRYKCVRDTIVKTEDGTDKTETCNFTIVAPLDLSKVILDSPKKGSNRIVLSEKPLLGVEFIYPTYEIMEEFSDSKSAEDSIGTTLGIIKKCIKLIYDADNVYDQFDDVELNEWLDQLTDPQLTKIIDFFNGIPEMKYDLVLKCKKCGGESVEHFEGLKSFFE